MIRFLGVLLAGLAPAGLVAGYVVGTRDPAASRWQYVPNEAAAPFGWESAWIETETYDLLNYRDFMELGAALLSVYIEGDGLPCATRTELSDDPSPRSARVLKLAVQGNAMNATYLPRPCQYLPAEALSVCPSNTWSFGRYGEDVVVALESTAAAQEALQ